MDDPNMTMEEYIKLEEEKARRRGRVFNWETATYWKIRVDDNLHDLRSVEAEFPAIVIDDAFAPQGALLCKCQILSPQHNKESDLNDETSLSKYDEVGKNILYFNDLFPFNVIHPDDLKSDEDNYNNDIDIIQSSKGNEIIQGSNVLTETNMAPLPPREQRHPFLRYQGLEYTDADIADFEERLERIYDREIHRVQVVDFQRMPELMRDGLFARMVIEHRDDVAVVVFTFSVRWSQKMIELEADYSDLKITYQGGDGVPRFAAGRKSGAHISGGHFVVRLAEHFGLLTAEILRGLTVIVLELPIIDMTELVRLQIYIEVDDTWAWVAIGPKRQPDTTAGTPEAPPPPPTAARTMPQRMARLEEDVHQICGMLAEQRKVISAMAHDISRFCTWTTTSLARMMGRVGPWKQSNIDEYWWRNYKSGDIEMLES
ncbi:hypothetical protein Tco_0466059 [Tanacetum coccineum]